MHCLFIKGVAAIGLALPGAIAAAAPMGYQGSTMAMGDFGHNWRELYVNHAISARDALGVSETWMRSDDERTTRSVTELAYTRLLRRWNLPHAQGNLWFLGGVGAVRTDGHSQAMVTPGIQADYETRRIYLLAMHRLYRASGMRHDYSALRAGFSFYETGYDETQPWLVLEARRMRALSDRVEVTPMLRLVNKGYFLEAGINRERQARFNFMLIF